MRIKLARTNNTQYNRLYLTETYSNTCLDNLGVLETALARVCFDKLSGEQGQGYGSRVEKCVRVNGEVEGHEIVQLHRHRRRRPRQHEQQQAIRPTQRRQTTELTPSPEQVEQVGEECADGAPDAQRHVPACIKVPRHVADVSQVDDQESCSDSHSPPSSPQAGKHEQHRGVVSVQHECESREVVGPLTPEVVSSVEPGGAQPRHQSDCRVPDPHPLHHRMPVEVLVSLAKSGDASSQLIHRQQIQQREDGRGGLLRPECAVEGPLAVELRGRVAVASEDGDCLPHAVILAPEALATSPAGIGEGSRTREPAATVLSAFLVGRRVVAGRGDGRADNNEKRQRDRSQSAPSRHAASRLA
ncbi:hypothetical protein PFISCL1PPCAC_3815, partial [Pristionchus fissidentatus]